MKDPRIQRLAEMMVQYSTDVQPKQKVLLRGECSCPTTASSHLSGKYCRRVPTRF